MVENKVKTKGEKNINDAEIIIDNTNKIKGNIFDKILNLLPEYLKDRVVPAIILGILAIIILYSSIMIFNLCILAIAILMAFEWITIARTEDGENNKWRFIGLGYIILPCISLIFTRKMTNGSDIILWLFLVVWATDTAAMIVGMTFGGPKLAPTISPKKTWSGLAGGVVASMFVGLLCSVLFKQSAFFFIILSGFMAVLEQIGDLTESKFKRHFNVKDSGNLIPGHGGIMDRVDGLTLTAPLVALLAMLSNSIF